MDIEKKRAEIDEIDAYITKLFLRRMQICGEIGHYKKDNDIRVYDEEREKEILAGLDSASGLMKKEIGRQIRMRRVPQLIFKMDHSMDYGRHIDEILSTMDFDSYQKDEEEDQENSPE